MNKKIWDEVTVKVSFFKRFMRLAFIELLLCFPNMTAQRIAMLLGISSATLSRELNHGSQCDPTLNVTDPIWIISCKLGTRIGSMIEDCISRLNKPPHVCNGCPWMNECKEVKFVYRAEFSLQYHLQQMSRKHVNEVLTNQMILNLDKLIRPLAKKGQTLPQIFRNHKGEIPCSLSTLRRAVEAGYFSFNIKDVSKKYKIRYVQEEERVPFEDLDGRTYDDFMAYIESDSTGIVEVDTVRVIQSDGTVDSEGPCILSINLNDYSFVLLFLLPARKPEYVKAIFDRLEALLKEDFNRIFRVILVDNGREFNNSLALEISATGKRRTRVFYCDRGQPWQKPHVESQNRLVRRYVPMGIPFDKLNDEKVIKMMNHINSIGRPSLGSGDYAPAAYDIFKDVVPESFLKAIGAERIPDDEVVLNHTLIMRNNDGGKYDENL